MFRKILLPYDGSTCSRQAARYAAELAKQCHSTVEPFVAVEYHLAAGNDLPEDVAGVVRASIARNAQQALDGANAILREAGAKSSGGRIREGRPAEAVLEEATLGEFDLIILGSHGVSLERGYDRLIGSVTERVLHRAPCPVLVIRNEVLDYPTGD